MERVKEEFAASVCRTRDPDLRICTVSGAVMSSNRGRRDTFVWRVVLCYAHSPNQHKNSSSMNKTCFSFNFFVFIDTTLKNMSENKIYTRKAQKKSIHFIYFFLLLCTHTLVVCM